MNVANNIQNVRESRGLTREKLSALLPDNPAPTSIYRWEKGQRDVTLGTLEAIAEALKCPVADLVSERPPTSSIDPLLFQACVDEVTRAVIYNERKDVAPEIFADVVMFAYNEAIKDGVVPQITRSFLEKAVNEVRELKLDNTQ